jgi:glutamate---cysteine ligase / carboxylate-amine ligase
MEHRFTGPEGTVGVEEELMILDAASGQLASEIETLLAEAPDEQVKPELIESVLEIATVPCSSISEADAELRRLRADVRERAGRRGLTIAAAGTHPLAHWEDQRIVGRDRYRGLVNSLGFVARQELVFGMHVHVGVADPEEAIHAANGLRPLVPLLVALAANSPFWRGMDSGLQSSRIPVFRAFPRVGIPPRWDDWADFVRRVELLMRGGAIEDYTYLWYDVRPHPRLGTVEVRAMDAQTEVRHTVALTALIQCAARELVERSRDGEPAPDPPPEVIDENKWLAARHGLAAELVQLPGGDRRSARELAAELVDRLGADARALGCERELAGIGDILEHGNGADRQRMVWEANHDLDEVVAELVAHSGGS